MVKKHRGFEKVDAYLIPKKEAGPYKRDRKAARKLAVNAMRTFCERVECGLHGGEDGEAVMGFDKKGECIAFIHLDPEGVPAILEAAEQGRLVEMLKTA